MALQVDWQGVYPAVPTQFNEDFSLDIKGTQKHVEALLSEGIHGLVMLGTIGENCSLSLDEKIQVLKATDEVNKGSVPLINGIAEFTTAGACETASPRRMLVLMALWSCRQWSIILIEEKQLITSKQSPLLRTFL